MSHYSPNTSGYGRNQFGNADHLQATHTLPDDPREKLYRQTKNLHNNINIDVPDLFAMENHGPSNINSNNETPNNISANKVTLAY